MYTTVPAVQATAPNFRPIRGLLRGLGDDSTDTGTTGDTGTITDPEILNYLNGPPLTVPTPTSGYTDTPDTAAEIAWLNGTGPMPSSSATGSSAAQILAAAAQAAAAGTQAYKATQSPSLIPGTNLVYNPATGQLTSATGVAATAVTSGISSMLPLLLIGGLILIVSGAGKH